MVAMLTPLISVALDLQHRYKQSLGPIISKMSKGIASLPEELLPIIFGFAVRAAGATGAKQAKWLSQVSRRFRKTALEDFSLWTMLRSSASREELEATIARSGMDSDLHAFIHITPHWFPVIDFGVFMNVCGSTLSRWRTLSVTKFVPSGLDEGEGMMAPDVEYVLKSLHHGVQLSRLQELYIQGGDSKPSRFPLSWASPNLRLLRCARYLPLPSTTFSSVSTFCFTQFVSYNYASEAQGLLSFLASTPNISSFELEINEQFVGSINKTSEPLEPPGLVCPSIKSFHLRLTRFWMPPQDRVWVRLIAAFLRALFMPHLEDLSISIEFLSMGHNEKECTNILTDCSYAVLPVYVAHPNTPLSSLNYNLVKSVDWNGGSKRFPNIFTIPLDRIPTISSLTVSTCTQLLFTCASDGAIAMNSYRMPCSLREVRFVGCRDMQIGDFQSAVQSLKDAEIWDSIELVVVEGCYYLDYNGVLDVIGKERLCYLT